jgi:uroporphyrinogen decarboxylase
MSNDPAWENLKKAARGEVSDCPPVAMIVDSPWLPGLAGIDTRDYFLFPEEWFATNLQIKRRWPQVAWIPGFWPEYGMAAEPSGFGAKLHFYSNQPPSIVPVTGDLRHWAAVEPADPQSDGLMPLLLRWTEVMARRTQAEGLRMNVACARGPLAVGSWLAGMTPLLEGFAAAPELVAPFLETLTTTIIAWLQAQLDCLPEPEGIMLLDDVVGMVSRRHYEVLVAPHLRRIFDTFKGLVRIYHNDTPCPHLYPSLAEAGFEVFNFTHKVEIASAYEKMGGKVTLMGNVAPLDLGARGTPQEVYTAARACIQAMGQRRGLILSFGGGVSPGTPPENIDALVRAAEEGYL